MSKKQTIECQYCQKKFEKNSNHIKYNLENDVGLFCSNICRSLSKGTLVRKNCNNCLKEILVTSNQVTHNNFCGHSCSATYSNKNRLVTNEQKTSVSNTLKNGYRSGRIKVKKYVKFTCIKSLDEKVPNLKTNIVYANCTSCNKLFIRPKKRPHKTCSRECAIKAGTLRTYLNGSRKTIKYFNKHQLKEITLESSWELKLAEFLDNKEQIWIRPDPVKWTDSFGKSHLYYPDFYLPRYNIYVDPKNPYCMDHDKEKMNDVSKRYTVIFGDIDYVISEVLKLI